MTQTKSLIKRSIPLLLIILGLVVVYFSGLTDYIDYEVLKLHRQELIGFVQEHSVLSPILFTLIYLITVAISIPGAGVLTIVAGFLFDQPLSTIYSVIGGTIGACIIFLAAKTAIGDYLQRRAGKLMHKMEKGFQENATSYLFFLRLVPIFPFWLVNLAPAFFGVSLWAYFWTTLIGIIPGTFVYTQAGSALGAILDAQNGFSLHTVFNWEVKVALIAIGFFALIPILVKRIKRKYREKHPKDDSSKHP